MSPTLGPMQQQQEEEQEVLVQDEGRDEEEDEQQEAEIMTTIIDSLGGQRHRCNHHGRSTEWHSIDSPHGNSNSNSNKRISIR